MTIAPAHYLYAGAMRALLLLAIWLVASEGARDGLLIGIPAALAGAIVSVRILPPGPAFFNPARFAILWPGFIARSVRAGADVAWRAFHPGLPVRPGWTSLDCKLSEGPLRTLLGAEISLLPGTLSAGTKQDCLCIHQLDARQDLQTYLASREDDIARAFRVPGDQGGGSRDE